MTSLTHEAYIILFYVLPAVLVSILAILPPLIAFGWSDPDKPLGRKGWFLVALWSLTGVACGLYFSSLIQSLAFGDFGP